MKKILLSVFSLVSIQLWSVAVEQGSSTQGSQNVTSFSQTYAVEEDLLYQTRSSSSVVIKTVISIQSRLNFLKRRSIALGDFSNREYFQRRYTEQSYQVQTDWFLEDLPALYNPEIFAVPLKLHLQSPWIFSWKNVVPRKEVSLNVSSLYLMQRALLQFS
jgi:hypothetical protein